MIVTAIAFKYPNMLKANWSWFEGNIANLSLSVVLSTPEFNSGEAITAWVVVNVPWELRTEMKELPPWMNPSEEGEEHGYQPSGATTPGTQGLLHKKSTFSYICLQTAGLRHRDAHEDAPLLTTETWGRRPQHRGRCLTEPFPVLEWGRQIFRRSGCPEGRILSGHGAHAFFRPWVCGAGGR